MSDTAKNVRTRSPDDALAGDKKRRRKVLSCYDCRRRKLQCDRALPACGRCVKAGQECLYVEEANEQSDDAKRAFFDGHISRPMQAPAASGDLLSRLEFQDRRIKQLEAALAEAAQQPPTRGFATRPSVPIAGEFGTVVTDRETMLLRGHSFKTQFLGSTHPSGLIAHLPELNQFTKETFEQFPALLRIRQDLKRIDERDDTIAQPPNTPTVLDLKASLPSKMETDSNIQLYLDTYGSIYHVLHLPSFWKEYDTMWNEQGPLRPHFVALVLVMIANVQCLANSATWSYSAGSSKPRERAIYVIQLCDNWIQSQSQKHVTVTDFQVRLLIQLGKQTCARKYKRAWTETGTLVRFCMGAGLHRNPDLIRKATSPLDKELRRRIWASVVEMELQAALDRGMIPISWPQQSDAQPPGNFNDDHISQDTEPLPMPRASSIFTKSWYLSQAGESIGTRHMMATLLNNIRQSLSFDDVKRFTDEIHSYLQSIPEWNNPEPGSAVANALLSLNLRQYLLVLHDRHLRQAECTSERSFCRMTIIDTATAIIGTHRSLYDKHTHALQVLCQDQLRAALSLVYVAVSPSTSTLRAQATLLNSASEPHTAGQLDSVIEMLTDKVLRFGREQRQLWITLAAQGYWRSKLNPEQRTTYMREAVNKITQPYYKIMACQEEGGSHLLSTKDNSTAAVTPKSPKTCNGMLDYLPNHPNFTPKANGTATGELGMINDPPLLDLDELAEWTFDDWSFSPTEIQQVLADYT